MPNRFLKKAVPAFRFDTGAGGDPCVVLVHNQRYEIRAGKLIDVRTGRVLGRLVEDGGETATDSLLMRLAG